MLTGETTSAPTPSTSCQLTVAGEVSRGGVHSLNPRLPQSASIQVESGHCDALEEMPQIPDRSVWSQ
jgi:hypothetical protein